MVDHTSMLVRRYLVHATQSLASARTSQDVIEALKCVHKADDLIVTLRTKANPRDVKHVSRLKKYAAFKIQQAADITEADVRA